MIEAMNAAGVPGGRRRPAQRGEWHVGPDYGCRGQGEPHGDVLSPQDRPPAAAGTATMRLDRGLPISAFRRACWIRSSHPPLPTDRHCGALSFRCRARRDINIPAAMRSWFPAVFRRPALPSGSAGRVAGGRWPRDHRQPAGGAQRQRGVQPGGDGAAGGWCGRVGRFPRRPTAQCRGHRPRWRGRRSDAGSGCGGAGQRRRGGSGCRCADQLRSRSGGAESPH